MRYYAADNPIACSGLAVENEKAGFTNMDISCSSTADIDQPQDRRFLPPCA